MSSIIAIQLEPIDCSEFIRVNRAVFSTECGSSFKVDIPQFHDSVAILLYHTEREALIFVKQFRPAVYLNRVSPASDDIKTTRVCLRDRCSSGSAELGYTHELCDGIIDKPGLSPVDIAREEILEECGYAVPREKIELITTCRWPEGGSLEYFFYAEVNDSMKASAGGGNASEGEQVEVVYIPVAKAKEYLIYDETVQRPASLMFCVLWFIEEKWKDLDGICIAASFSSPAIVRICKT